MKGSSPKHPFSGASDVGFRECHLYRLDNLNPVGPGLELRKTVEFFTGIMQRITEMNGVLNEMQGDLAKTTEVEDRRRDYVLALQITS